MYVLKLTPDEAAKYYDTYHERSFRQISLVLWTLNGDPEPEDFSTKEENDAWWDKQIIKVISRADLESLELADNQELRLDAAVWLQRLPSRINPTGLAIFSHEMQDNSPYRPYTETLILSFMDGEEVDRLQGHLHIERPVVFGRHNSGVIESS